MSIFKLLVLVLAFLKFDEPAHYYLDQLKYWNEALIHAIEKIRENTGNRFVEKWQRVTESRG